MIEDDTQNDISTPHDKSGTLRHRPRINKEEPPRRGTDVKRALRFMYILHHALTLPEGQTLTKARLAEICRCSPKTIQRDMKKLEAEFGVTYDGTRKSFVLPEGALPALDLRLDVTNVLALGLAEGLMRNVGVPQQQEILVALEKVTHGLSPKLRHLLRTCADALTPALMPFDYTDAPLFPLLSAVRLRQTVSIDYDSASSGTRTWRKVDPYTIELRDGVAWEMHGWCHKNRAFRTFALDAVHQVRSEEVPYTYRDKEWETFRSKNVVGGLRDDTASVPIEVHFAPKVARYALRRHWPASLTITRESDGSALLRGHIPGGVAMVAMVSLILHWRQFATVRGGPEFLAAFREEVAALSALYAENSQKVECGAGGGTYMVSSPMPYDETGTPLPVVSSKTDGGEKGESV